MGKEEEKKKEKEKTKTWPSDAEREQARKEARSAHEKNRLSWFERSEHKAVRTCVCLCGHTFRSQARDLACATVKKVKDEDGKVVLDKQSGKAKLMRVDVKKCLTRTACPECKSIWLQSFT